MANESYIVFNSETGEPVNVRLIDNGDDTFSISTAPPFSTTPTRTNVPDATSSTKLLDANLARVGATIYNDSNADLYLACGTSATNTSFTIKLGPGDYYEVPFNYKGDIYGVWSANTAGGEARITEFT